MSQPAVRIQKLGKRYHLGARVGGYATMREAIVAAARSPWQRLKDLSGRGRPEDSFWALRDVNLEIEDGDVVGIIGHNGAGKSTLLKVLSQITEPTTGYIEIRGRVGSLLEVGTGFHPELTGRENVFLNGAVLGMSRHEVKRKFDEIVSFAGIGEFLDTPVKRYSSGMHVRLAFAVAAHLEPEILIVDEVLAVGDADFQNKCLGKMGEVANSGRTVLFVSHNMAAVESLCHRVCLLENGRLVAAGNVIDVLGRYIDSSCELTGDIDLHQHPGRPAACRPVFRRLRILDEYEAPKPVVRIGESIRFELELESNLPFRLSKLAMRVVDARGLAMFTSIATDDVHAHIAANCPMKTCCEVRNIRLAPGRYHLQPFLRTGSGECDEIRSGLEFEVLPLVTGSSTRVPAKRLGVLVAESQWDVPEPTSGTVLPTGQACSHES